jgi:hypothetical protein
LGSDFLAVVSVLVFICDGGWGGVKRVVGCKRVHTRLEGTWVGKSYVEKERAIEERAKTRGEVL